jgi:integrase
VIPAIRNKGKVDHLLPLTDTLLNLLDAKNKRGFMFSSDSGRKAFSGFSKAKAVLDTKLAAMRKAAGGKPMQAWVFHDLRRTARSLMARAGVPSDHAEQVLGHVVPGVRGVYDRHEYRDEKLAALEKLGALLERILQPGERIVSFPKEERRKAKAR